MSDEVKVASARLEIQVYVNCPHCDSLINLMNSDDTSGVDHNDCGEILRQACPSEGNWSDSHDDFELEEVTCTSCKGDFDVKTIEW